MKKNLVNKKVVSSIGIGIMAFITATSPAFTVLAEDNTEQPAPEPAPAVETNTSDSDNQRQTEPVPSEQSQAVDNAQTAVADAKVESPDNATLEGINTALGEADAALGNIASDVAALDEANKAVTEANGTLADGMLDDGQEKYGDEIEEVKNAAAEVEKNIKDLTEEEIKGAADSAAEKAGDAEAAQDKTYENVDAAKTAEQKVKDDLAEVEEEDGVLDRVENAEDALNGVETQIEILQGALDTNEAAKGDAEKAAENASGKLDEVLSEDMKKMTEEEKAALDGKLQAVTESQESLTKSLKDNKENISNLAKQIEEKDDIEGTEKAELVGLIEKLAEFDELNKYEQDKCLEGLGKFADITLGEKSVAAMVQEYMTAYTDALNDHVKALEALVTHMDDMSVSLTGDAKTALEKAKTALEAAKQYEKDCLEAYNQVNDIMDAAVAVQEAQTALDANTNVRKDELIKIENGDGEQQGQKQKVETAFDTFDDIERLEAEIEELENDIKQFKEAHTDWGIVWSDAHAQYKALVDKKEEKEDELKKKDKSAAWTNYIRAMDDLAKTRIEYILLDEGATNISIGNWESNQKDNNYVPVTYTVIGEDGIEYIRTEYFDYTHDGADVTVVRKEAISKAAEGHELGVTVVDGKPVYRYGDETIPNEKVTITDNGYYIDGVNETIETYTFKPELEKNPNIVLTVITKPGGGTSYTITGGNLKDPKELKKKDIIWKDGKISGFKYQLRSYEDQAKPSTSITQPAFFENTGTFTDKGGRPVTEENYADKVTKYTEDKANSEQTLLKALEALRKSADKADGSLSGVGGTKDIAEDYLKDETVKNAEAIGNVVTTATTANTAASNTWNTSKAVKNSVDNAYLGIANAIRSILNAQANKADTEAYDKVKAAVDTHNEAADLLNKDDFETLKGAAEILRTIADESFRYNTPSTTPGGTTGGGTTGGGTTGGGTGAGGTGGGAGTPVVAAPVAVVPTAAAPLAGPGAGLVTVEDEVTPLAGPAENEGLTTLEDETTPLAGPADLTNVALPIGTVAKMNQMSWWWLLIVAVLGVTGEEMYRRHQKKQREEAGIEN